MIDHILSFQLHKIFRRGDGPTDVCEHEHYVHVSMALLGFVEQAFRAQGLGYLR